MNATSQLPTSRTSDAVWDIRFLTLARLVASWSKDPSTQCGAVLVRQDKTIAGTGYNGFPRAMVDDPAVLGERATKYPRILHAEWNAVRSCRDGDLTGAVCYSWPLPSCDECTAVVLQKNIGRIVHGRPNAVQAERWKVPFGRAKSMAKKRKVALTALDLPGDEAQNRQENSSRDGDATNSTDGRVDTPSCDGVVRWHRRFLSVARLVASWTHDGMPAESCILVRPDRSIASVGFAGFPRGINSEDGGRVLLAVQNALLFTRDQDLSETTAYCWPAPNVRAVAHLIQDRVRRVVVPGVCTGIPLLGEDGMDPSADGTRRDAAWATEVSEAARILVLAGGSIMSVAT